MRKLSVIIPSYNEAKTIAEVVNRVYEVVLPDWSKEVIVVDDGSTDNTKEVLEELKPKFSTLKVVTKSNGGKGSAIKFGLGFVTGDYVLIQDADLECDPFDYPALLAPVIEGQGVSVMGSRNMLGKEEMKKSRLRYGNIALTKLFNVLVGSRFTDITGCYKIFPAVFREELILLPSNDFVFDAIELTYFINKRSRVVEVPVKYFPRTVVEGKKLRIGDGFKCVMGLIKLIISR